MDGPPPSSPDAWVILIEDIQADARAGMVPKGEVASAVAVQHSLQARLDEETTWAAKWKKERDEARADLAKAWEAGAMAQRDSDKDTLADNDYRAAAWFIDKYPLIKPPGGKAK
jgi:hypothetical protein